MTQTTVNRGKSEEVKNGGDSKGCKNKNENVTFHIGYKFKIFLGSGGASQVCSRVRRHRHIQP